MNNNLQLNDSYVNFKATANEIKSIKKACLNLAKNNIKAGHKEPVDIAEIGNKAYISSISRGNQTLVKVELKNDKGANAYTLIKTGSLEDTKKFLNLPKSVNKLADIIDSLKETVKRTTERESYTDF